MSHIKGFVLPTLSPHACSSGTLTVNILNELRCQVSGLQEYTRMKSACTVPKWHPRTYFYLQIILIAMFSHPKRFPSEEFSMDGNKILRNASVSSRYWWQLQICIYSSAFNYKHQTSCGWFSVTCSAGVWMVLPRLSIFHQAVVHLSALALWQCHILSSHQ